MTDEIPDDETDPIEDEPELEVEEPDADEAPEADAEELVVTIDGGDEPEPETVVLQHLRKVNRDHMKRIKELEAKALQPAPVVALGPEPDLKDFDYDTPKYNAARDAWRDKKRDADARALEVKAESDRQNQEWNTRITAYRDGASRLGVRDFEEAEDVVKSALNPTQQGVIVHAFDNSPLVVYALGKNPKKAAELAKITDPVLFAVAVTRLEERMKVSGMKTTPAPEKRIKGGVAVIAGGSKLEKLRAEADRTGDITPVLKYKREMAALAKK